MFFFPDLNYFLKSIKEAEICMVFIDFFERNNAKFEQQYWKNKLLDALIEINNDDYYNTFFSDEGTQPMDKVTKEAANYFSTNDDDFRKYLLITLSLNSKLRPLNNKALKDKIKDAKAGNKKINIEENLEVHENDYIGLFHSIIFNYNEENAKKHYESIKLVDNQQLITIFELIIKEVLLADKKTASIALANIINNITSLKSKIIRRQDYESAVKLIEVTRHVTIKKIEFDIENQRTFDEIMPELNNDMLVEILKFNFKKGIEFVDYLLEKDNKHHCLINLFLHFATFSDNIYINKQPEIPTDLLLRLLQININKVDEKNALKAIFAFESGIKSKYIDSTQKFFDKIVSPQIKSSTIKLIWSKAFLNSYNVFLLKNIAFWKDDKSLLEKYILNCVAENRNQEINEIYSLVPSEYFFRILIQINFDNDNEEEIQKLVTKFPKNEDLIKKIENEFLEAKIVRSVESILIKGNFKKLIPIINRYPNKSRFIEETVESFFRSKQSDAEDIGKFIFAEDIPVIITLYNQNRNILRYMLFEKTKRAIFLNENIETLNELENILDLDIWKQTIQK